MHKERKLVDAVTLAELCVSSCLWHRRLRMCFRVLLTLGRRSNSEGILYGEGGEVGGDGERDFDNERGPEHAK